MKKTMKILLALPIIMLIFVFSGCTNNTDGTDTPLLLLPYTSRGGEGTGNLLISAKYDTSELNIDGNPKYGGLWYGCSVDLTDDDTTPPYVPVEDYKSLQTTPFDKIDSLKILVRIDNKTTVENHWPYTDNSTLDNSNNFVAISDLPIGFHHLDVYIPGFSVMSEDINVKEGQNYLNLTATPPDYEYQSYFS
jgi:hypothetical protein